MRPRLGLYEKALPAALSWDERLARAADLGFDFVELALDPSPERLARLDRRGRARAELRGAVRDAPLPIATLVLSAHRRSPLGSASTATRRRARELTARALELAGELGAATVQLAGYFVFEEPHWEGARAHFLDGLAHAAELAEGAGVTLGLENMDGEDVTSLRTALELIDEVGSPRLQLYPDLGNLAANGCDVTAELRAARGRIVGVHLKDARPGAFRRVPFGAGVTPFEAAFGALEQLGYDGPFAVEMWNDGEADAAESVRAARVWIEARMSAARPLSEKDRPPR